MAYKATQGRGSEVSLEGEFKKGLSNVQGKGSFVGPELAAVVIVALVVAAIVACVSETWTQQVFFLLVAYPSLALYCYIRSEE